MRNVEQQWRNHHSGTTWREPTGRSRHIPIGWTLEEGGGRDVCGVITTRHGIGGMPGERIPRKGENLGRLQEHFMYRHWKSKVAILKEVPTPLPQCTNCVMHMPYSRLEKHKLTVRCNLSMEIKLQWMDLEFSQRYREMEFSLYVREVYELV